MCCIPIHCKFTEHIHLHSVASTKYRAHVTILFTLDNHAREHARQHAREHFRQHGREHAREHACQHTENIKCWNKKYFVLIFSIKYSMTSAMNELVHPDIFWYIFLHIHIGFLTLTFILVIADISWNYILFYQLDQLWVILHHGQNFLIVIVVIYHLLHPTGNYT